MKKINKSPQKIIIIFYVTVFITILISIFISFFLYICLLRRYSKVFARPFFICFYICTLSIILSTIIYKIINAKIFIPIKNLGKAAKEVAGGNYEISLSENLSIEEIKDMAHNFNIMTKALNDTEIIHKDFIQNISHEMKTPLSSIEGYATLLQSKELSVEKRLLYTSKIIKSTKRLSSLTNNILELSKLENNNKDLGTSYFSLDEQIREAILLFEDKWTVKNIEFSLDLQEIKYSGSEKLLYEVWQNIINNAIKFTPINGLIKIESINNKDSIIIKISDNGIGMDEKTQNRIFEKFYQGETSHNLTGNGLGLALAKKIINLHNGTISVASAPNEGSCFTITLPKKKTLH